MKLVEKRYIAMGDLRTLCVTMDFYTCGDGEEYDTMLKKAGYITTEEILDIAVDIADHSDFEKLSECLDCPTYTDFVKFICWLISKNCLYDYEIVA